MLLENENGYKYIYLKDFLDDYFKSAAIQIIGKNPIDMLDLNNKPWDYFVSVNDKYIEWNMRLAEGRLPETLYYLLSFSNQHITIRNLIKKVCKSNPDKIPTIRPMLYLEFRMYHFFEMILYGEVLNKVFKGRWLTDRCYVLKRNQEIEYYHLFDSRKLVYNLLDWLCFAPREFIQDGKIGYELQFSFIDN